MLGKSALDAVYLIRQLQEKYGEEKGNCTVFVDVGKTFDEVARDTIRLPLQ